MDHREVRWVWRKLSKLRSEIEVCERAAQGVIAAHWTSGLYTLSFWFFGSWRIRLGDDWKQFTHRSCAFKHSNVLVKRLHKTKSRRLSRRMQRPVQNIESAVCTVGIAGKRKNRSDCRPAGPRKRHYLKWNENLLVRDGICLSMEKMVKTAETKRTGSSFKNKMDERWLSGLKRRHFSIS